MIRLLVRFGSWLDQRFPERVEVRKADYVALLARLEALDARLAEVQRSAVHKDAVRDVVLALQKHVDEFASFKVAMGYGKPIDTGNQDLNAVLNGEFLNHGN